MAQRVIYTLAAVYLVASLFARVQAQSEPDQQVRLFVSTSLGETQLRALMRADWGGQAVSLVVRGLEPDDRTLDAGLQRWHRRMIEAGEHAQGVEIDPVAFREDNIDRVPALSLRVNGRTELTAYGITSVDWLLRQHQSGRRGLLGVYGSTRPIRETDFLQQLQRRWQQTDWSSSLARARHRALQRTHHRMSLPTAQQAQDFRLPLSSPWNRPLIVLDARQAGQRQSVMAWLSQYPQALVLLTHWSVDFVNQLPDIWQAHELYLAPAEVVSRFRLTALPALLTPESGHWRVQVAAPPSRWVTMLTWVLSHLHQSVSAVQALEEAKNPSKALCESVAVLSEKIITWVPWKELFPIRIGALKMKDGKEPKGRAQANPIGMCLCEDANGVPFPGLTVSFWRPQRLIELTRSPGCLMALGGVKLGITNKRRWGTLGTSDIVNGVIYLHAHVYSLPLVEMLEMYAGIGGCNSDLVDFDLVNFSEADPTWQHPELALLLSPDMVAYANPMAQTACGIEGTNIIRPGDSHPMDSLHWCAGSWGALYPMSGFTSTYGHFADNTSLLATRALAKLHRIGLARKTVGEDLVKGRCKSRITPWLPKSQYKMSMFWPEPEKHSAHWIGTSAAQWGMHRHPLGKDDAMYLVWQYRDCCQTVLSQ